MSETAARLQTHNQEMVKCLSLLRHTRSVLEDRIGTQEKQMASLRREIDKLQRSLAQMESSVEDNRKKLGECTKCLTETEMGYNKVVDTLQLLLLSAKENSAVPNE